MTTKCDCCVYSRTIVSENGIHAICCLSSKAAVNCLTGKENWHIAVKKTEQEGT